MEVALFPLRRKLQIWVLETRG